MQPRFNIYYKEYGSSLCGVSSDTNPATIGCLIEYRSKLPGETSLLKCILFNPSGWTICSRNIARKFSVSFHSFFSFFFFPPKENFNRRLNPIVANNSKLLLNWTWNATDLVVTDRSQCSYCDEWSEWGK